MVVEKSVLIKVVFPNPDSPATFVDLSAKHRLAHRNDPTIIVNAAPLFATILCLSSPVNRVDSLP